MNDERELAQEWQQLTLYEASIYIYKKKLDSTYLLNTAEGLE